MTKKLIVLALTAVLAVLGLFLCAKKARAEYLDSIGIIYRFPAEVVAVLPRENSVFVEDTEDGNQFSFEGIEDFRVGESVIVYAGDAHTPDDRTDDVILNVVRG